MMPGDGGVVCFDDDGGGGEKDGGGGDGSGAELEDIVEDVDLVATIDKHNYSSVEK